MVSQEALVLGLPADMEVGLAAPEVSQEIIDANFSDIVAGLEATTPLAEQEAAAASDRAKLPGSGDKPGKWWDG